MGGEVDVDGLQFDAQVSGQIEAVYTTPDVIEQRRAVRAALALRPRDRVLDVGVGPGHCTRYGGGSGPPVASYCSTPTGVHWCGGRTTTRGWPACSPRSRTTWRIHICPGRCPTYSSRPVSRRRTSRSYRS